MSGKSTSTIQRPETPPRASDQGRSRLGDITRPVSIDRRIARPGRSTILLGLAAFAIAGALAAALFVLPVQTYLGQDARIADRGEQLQQLEKVNADLRTEVERLRTDDGVREAAREELGYVSEGERRETMLELPAVPTVLPVGWPYDLVTDIVALKTGAAPAIESTGPEPAAETQP